MTRLIRSVAMASVFIGGLTFCVSIATQDAWMLTCGVAGMLVGYKLEKLA